MLRNISHIVVSTAIVFALIGCSGTASKSNDSEGGQSKVQSAGSSSELDKELKRQGDIYKELLKHNTEMAEKHNEADRKLLKKMEKNEQEARKRELKELQEKAGLIGGIEDEQDAGGGKGGEDGGEKNGESEKSDNKDN